ncbi:unnamed protein product, partial [Choristocarpus tenellus]
SGLTWSRLESYILADTMETHRTEEDRGGDGSHMFVFTNAKAGMEKVDKERANRIIYDMSKGSSFFKQAEVMDKKLDTKVEKMKKKSKELDQQGEAQLLKQADLIVVDIEKRRVLDQICMVVDMDMFYAAVEIRDQPDLSDKPVAVGGMGMISTTNYVARKYGVRSAMPGFIGKKLCPELVFVKPDFDKYTKVAEQIRSIFRDYDPHMQSYSLDEAYLNVTQEVARRVAAATEPEGGGSVAVGGGWAAILPGAGGEQCSVHDGKVVGLEGLGQHMPPLRGDEDEEWREEWGDESGESGQGEHCHRFMEFKVAEALAQEIRCRIRDTTRLTASVGIAPNFMLAKVASDWNKPDGQMGIPGDLGCVRSFLRDLPTRKVGGVGKVTEKCLREALGVSTCGQLLERRAAILHLFTTHTARWLLE